MAVRAAVIFAATLAAATAHAASAGDADPVAKPNALQKSRLAALVRSQTRTPPQRKVIPLQFGAAGGTVASEAAFQAWSFQGRAGELVTVEIDSDDFDPMYYVTSASPPYEILDADDDSGPGRGARVRLELPKDGTYLVRSDAPETEEGGVYELSLAVEPPLEFTGGGAPGGRYALLVGIDDYPALAADLLGPTADVALVKQLLVDRFGFRESDVLVLENERATRRNLIEAFRNHLGQAGPEGLAFLYFSGHGAQLDENLGFQDAEEDGVDEVWYLANGTVLLDDEFAYLSAGLATDRLTVVVDSCHAGGAFRGAFPSIGFAKGLTAEDVVPHMSIPSHLLVAPREGEDVGREGTEANPKHLFIAASAPDERSWAMPSWDALGGGPASVFTFFLVRAVSDGSSDRSFAEVMRRVQAETADYTETELHQQQTPMITGGPSESRIADRLDR